MVDMTERLRDALRAAAQHYRAGEMDARAMQVNAKRISALRGRSQALQRCKERSRKIIRAASRSRGWAQEAIWAGRTILAIDVGYNVDDGPLEDIGICLYDTVSKSQILGLDLLIEGRGEHRTSIPFHFGRTEIIPESGALRLVQTMYDAAGLVVFHGAHTDLKKLRIKTCHTTFVDTAEIARAWCEDTPSLDALCAFYGIDNADWHNSGNDARRTNDVLLAQVMDPRPFRPHIVRSPMRSKTVPTVR